ncbi:MAG: DUF4082 domain-containing protein [Chitinophagaceae bacterium]|nr:DUF4082 domain-containing protein [Chitinophagaceae bacterium]
MARKPLSFFVAGRKQLLALFFGLASFSITYSQNAIVTENALTGNPKSEWDISGAGDLSIQGYTTDISVNKGQTVQFKIDAGSGTAYTISIYRLGYYQGNGARLIANLGSFTGTAQPNPTTNTSTGLVDCGNWAVSASWAVPSTAVSGLYIAKLTKTSNGGSSHIVFVVRDDASTSAMLFKTSDATWQAYNPYGGNSLYVGSTSYPNGHAAKVSYNRPFITRNGGGGGGAMEDWFMNAEFPMIRFLERNGYDITYTTDVDMDRTTINYTPAKHKVIMSVGHDEYWSLNERNKFEAARAAGVHLAFFSGNEVYWKTRWENSNRTLVCYKEGTLGENVCGNKCDPTTAWTGLWRDGAAYDAGKPENALTGQISWNDVTSSITVPSAYKNLRFWRNTSVASLANGATATFPSGTLGYEWDYRQYESSYPPGMIVLSSTTVGGKEHRLTLYRHSSGALVFGAGTVQWSWGLDNIHDRGSAAPSTPMQQATVNLFADMGVQPGSLMAGLVAATASTDVTAPVCVISSPAHGATLPSGSAVTVSGTASDAGGVLVGIEVSIDGGTTWQPATGTSSWSFSWTPSTTGTVNIRVRGFDDSGNMSVPGANGSSTNITVTIGSGGTPTCPCTIFTTSNTPATPNDTDSQPIETGVKFRSTQSGYITGIRFYKGTSNTGTHTGHLWSSTGTKLAEVIFTNETASGWQQMLFATPVAINANTTYVASYHSSSGYYASTSNYFTTAVVNGYLRALANGEDGVNGVYILTATGAFPTNSYQSSNYFVDVVYQTTIAPDVTPPTVSLTAPAAGTVSGIVNITANASDNVGVAGVQFLLNGANLGTEVTVSPYSFSWNTTTVANGTYTLTARARDAAGNITTSAGVVVTVSNVPDSQAPTVSVTSPAAGTVSGLVNITANASDNVGVAGVQFLLNGANLGTEVTAAPYTVSWNTLTSANGTYTLTARARDAAGNTTTSVGVVVTVNNNITNLIAALPMNEGSGTTAADISGLNHPGTLTNSPTWGTGKYGQGINLNGTNNYVNIADHTDFTLDPTKNYTWSLWVKNNNFNEWSTVWSQTVDASNFFYFYAHTSTDPDGGPVTNGISVYWWANGGSNKLGAHSNNNVLTAGQWSHVAITYNGTLAQNSRFTIYVNGVNVTATSDVSSTGTLPVINPANIRIGSNQPFGEYLNGSVDEVRFYSRLLTAAEVAADMNTPLAPDNTAPAVSITSPAAGTVTGTINVTASASDNVGVAGVQFLLNGANLGTEVTTSPYTFSWNTTTAVNGNYTLTARARDAAGNTTTSAGVAVTVNNDTQAPAVSITAPAAGIVNGTISVTANASDNTGVAGVQFLLDGNNLGAEDVTSPYSISWNTTTITDGLHTLTARARDAAGNITTSAGVVVTVQNNPPDTEFPVVSITAPAAGNVSGTVNVTANATDNVGVVGVQFLLNGANLGSEDLATPYAVSWNTTTVVNGTYTLTARARDAAGNITTSAGVVVTVNNIPDTQAPTVSITAPAAGTVTGTINVNANAADNVGVVGVQFLLNGVSLGAEDVSSPYSISWNTLTSVNATYTLTARARDEAGNITTSAGVIVTVNNNTNLIAALNFNEGTGTTATDISGKNHPGTLVNGPTWGTGKYGQGVNLDGTNDYVNIADHDDFTLNPAQSYTWSGWIKNNNFNEWATVWSQTVDANNFFYFYAHTTTDPDGGPVTNGISVYWWANGGSNKLGAHSNNNVLTAGQWSYVAITYNGTLAQANRFTIYVNGVNVTATSDISSTGTLPTINPSNIRIGSNQPFGEYLNASIDEFRFYTRLLTATEIQTDMNSALSNVIVPVVTPANGATGVATNTTVTTVFNLTMDASTINGSTIELRNASDVLIPSIVTYNTTTRTATLTPSSVLANSVVYTLTIKGGASGIKDAGGGTMTSDYISSFTTAEPPLIAMTEGPGGPILAISSSTNPFSRYTLEILRAEGLNHFAAADISAVTATMLNNYDVVLLGEMTVTAAQATMFTDWVNAGGKLIAFKPSAQLNTLMGISAASGTLSDKYLLVNTASGPGAGIVNQTIQFHGTANLHTLSGASSLATLYSNATTATSNPAVTLRNVGANGGVAVAFTYDLPKSIIYTRQGNPAWAGQKRDGTTGPIRPDDLYFGQPAGTGVDWVDFNKIVIPQADEQQRFLANIILQTNLSRKPLPRFWYLPNGIKAAVIYALDDHGTSAGTSSIFSKMTTNSTVGCLVNNWECYRATSWFYQGIPLTNAQAVTYNSQGFEMGVHVQNNCVNFTSFANLDASYNTQLQNFQSAYPGLPAQTTHRFHCLAWSDWATQAKVELSRGIRLSLDYYYWPSTWVSGRPGLFTGSGMPMRFADTDGTMLDIYQGVSQLVNENGVNYTLGVNTLLDNALGTQGYYGIFGTHDDYTNTTFSDAIIASAKARNVPIITARQALTWLDSRSNSYFNNIAWNNNQLSFTIVARSNAYNLMTMLPFNSAGGQLLSVTMDGNPVTFTTQTIKGMQYGLFTSAIGIHNYVAVYSAPAARMITANTQSIVTEEQAKSSEATESVPLGDKLYVNVLPNPASSQFNMVISSNDATPVSVTVMNMFGQVVEQKQRVASTGILRIGQTWTSGTYFAEIVQGDKKKVVRLVKVN